VGELKRHFRDRGWALRVPRNVQETAILVNRTVSTMWQDLGRAPTVAEIASSADIGEDDVLQALDALQAYTTDSLDAPTPDATSTAAESIGIEDKSFQVSEEWLSLAPALRDLPERERTILYLRFFEGRTQTEIAETGIAWGTMSGDWRYVIGITILFYAMALILLGVWEIPIPGFLGTGTAGELSTRSGMPGAFFKGIITTLMSVT
jgi:hypothetical protein